MLIEQVYERPPMMLPLWLRHPVWFWRGWRDMPPNGQRIVAERWDYWDRGELREKWTRQIIKGQPGNCRVWSVDY